MNYLTLDTNIFTYMFLNSVESVTPTCFEHVKNLLDENKIILILPDIVQTEFKKIIKPEFENSQKMLKRMIRSIENAMLPLDVEDNTYSWAVMKELRMEAISKLKEILERCQRMDVNEQIKPILKIMEHDNTVNISVTEDSIMKSYERITNKKAPSHNKESFADGIIIESLIKYFSTDREAEKNFFISHNTNDLLDPEQRGQEKLHPDLIEDFDRLGIKYSPHLAKVLKDEFELEIDEKGINYQERFIGKRSYVFSWNSITQDFCKFGEGASLGTFFTQQNPSYIGDFDIGEGM